MKLSLRAFLNDKIRFLSMSDVIENCMEKITFVKNPAPGRLYKNKRRNKSVSKKIIINGNTFKNNSTHI